MGEVANAFAPLPVLVATPVPPLATGNVPVTVVTGTPVVPSKTNATDHLPFGCAVFTAWSCAAISGENAP